MFDPNDGQDEDDAPKTLSAGTPSPGDDFICIRYKVWYPSLDCAVRTRFQTSQGCLHCDQGRFNLKRHAEAVRRMRWRLAVGD